MGRFLEEFVRRAKALKIGPALDYSIEMGSLASQRQLGKAGGARERCRGAGSHVGGRRQAAAGPGTAVLRADHPDGVRPEMKVFAEETFGPVVSVYPFASEKEAIRLANASATV